MLEIRSLTKRYGEIFALDHVHLSLDLKKTHILLGSSGSGKSSLLRAILGLLPCDEGEILLESESVAAMSAERRASRIGYVPQEGGLFPHLTAERNATLVARAQGWDKKKIEARLSDLVSLVSLEPSLLERYPHELSGGQRQRVAVLRAAFLDPDLLLMDEPLGALDPMIRADLQKELKETFSRLKKTVIFVTHDLGEAAYLGDQIILMHEGKVVQQGMLADLRDRPASPFVTRFLNAQRIYDGEVSS